MTIIYVTHLLKITQWDTLSQSHEISRCLYLQYLLLLASINSGPIYNEYMINFRSHL